MNLPGRAGELAIEVEVGGSGGVVEESDVSFRSIRAAASVPITSHSMGNRSPTGERAHNHASGQLSRVSRLFT